MITPPSIVRDYDLIWSKDPALDAPEREPNETDDAWAERESNWEKRLTVARETGQWDGVLKTGQQPTIFRCRRISTLHWRRIQTDWNEVGPYEAVLSALRLAIQDIKNFGSIKIERERGNDRFGDALLAGTVVDVLREIPGLIDELGLAVIERESALPKT